MSYFYDKDCIFCDGIGTVELLTNDSTVIRSIEGHPSFMVEGLTRYHCTKCNEKWVDDIQAGKDSHLFDEARQHAMKVEARRKAENLLNGNEIKAIMEKLPYSAKEISKALGMSEVIFSKWLNNKSVQSKACDALLIAVSKNPSVIKQIAQRRGIPLTGRRQGRPRKKEAS